MLTFCTLFDSNYLDKGLVLYNSMKAVMKEFKLYILAMDDKCFAILKKMDLPYVTAISLTEFEDEELCRIRSERSRAEYCWTCTASLIDYIFENYQEAYCTYIDSDLYFFKNPHVLLNEMEDAGCSVQIVEHGFGKGWMAEEKIKGAGRYCVEFNTFKNDPYGREILKTWKDQCRSHCSMAPGEMGDQKYLSDWAEKYEKVHVLQHPGAGVAPWNVFRFRKTGQEGWIMDRKTKERFEMIFYHFHHLEYVDETTVNLNVFKKELGAQQALVYEIYRCYLAKLEAVKEMLSKTYGIKPLLKKHPGLVERTAQDKLKELKRMDPKELLYRVHVKLAYTAGKKADQIDLNSFLV